MIKPVEFVTAKLLKEKEFDKMCERYEYQSDSPSKESRLKFLTDEDYIGIPTIGQVVMWLYEKHGIWIECLHRGDMGDFTFKVSKLKKGWRTEPHYIHETGFNSPTEAYEAAIEYVLTNLI